MLNANQKQEVPLDEALELAQGHHQAGNITLAERTYRDILRVIPDHFPTTQLLGAILFQAGSFEEAKKYFELAVEAEPENPNCLNNYGGVLVQMKEYDRALKYLDKALEVNPESIDSLNNKAYLLWLKEDYKGTEDLSRKVLKHQNDNMIALNGLAMSLARQYRYEEALDSWALATKADPRNAMIWSNWGNALREMGRLKQAEEKCEKAVELEPNNPEALNNLANVLRDLGNVDRALGLYERATDEMPGFAEAHCNKAMAYTDNQQFDSAVIAAKYATAFKPDLAEGHSLMSMAHSSNGDFDKAHEAAQRAIHFSSPDQADPYVALADVLARLDRFDDSIAALSEALKREPESARAFLKLSEVYESLNNPEEAHNVIDRALELSPDMPRLYSRKGMIYHMQAKAEEALENMDKAIEMAPTWMVPYQQKAEVLLANQDEKAGEAMLRKAMEVSPKAPGPHIMLAGFKAFKNEKDPDFVALTSFEDDIASHGKDIEANYYFAMADAYETIKDYDKSFEYLEKAAELKLRISPETEFEQGLKEKLEGRRGIYNEHFIKKFINQVGCESDVPVFICGMPRSGTTLTEQTISSHPDVFGAGELSYIGDLAAYYSDHEGEVTADTFTEFGEEYLRRIQARDITGKAKRITDKMPGNCMNMGLISLALPNSKIILCRRNPMDILLSCLKQNFSSGHYWSYSLEELGDFYLEYEKMVQHWRDVLPKDRFLEIDYEDTVNNFEEQARMLIDYIGLEWNDACLEPHKQKRPVLTASRSQVNKPVYKTSVEKWRKYEKQLQPVVRKVMPDAALPVKEEAKA